MMQAIAIIDGLAAFAILAALVSKRMTMLPKWHRLWIGVIGLGMASQLAIEFGPVDRVGLPLWALKDAGIWGLLIIYGLQHARR